MSTEKKDEEAVQAQAQILTKDFAAVPIEQHFEHDQNRKAAKLAMLISTGQTNLTTARGIIEGAVGPDAIKIGKEAVANLLAPVKVIVPILDLLGQLHPAVQVAVGVVKVVVQLELDRFENDRHIAALYFSMTDLLFVLTYLDPVFEDDDGLKAQLVKQLKSIAENINAFGNFCDIYYKHISIVRTIFSGRYKGKLAEYAQAFADQKKELEFLVNQKSASTINAMKGTVNSVSTKIDKILDFIEKKSPEEQKAAEMVERRGGEAAVLENEKLLISIASHLGEKITSDLKSEMKFTLRSTLDDALQANKALYQLKFDAIRVQLQLAIERSTQTILLRMDSGPHELIKDEDIRAVWKVMHWRVSCKVRHFVDAVHHHFAQKFRAHQIKTGEPHPDFWTLNYMSKVIFHPAIGDAIDEDGSGYLTVTEVDQFFRNKPTGWSSPQWISYWAVGWYKNAILYVRHSQRLMEAIEESRKTILPQNKEYVEGYFNEEMPTIRIIVSSLYTGILGYHSEKSGEGNEQIHALRSERRAQEIATMRSQLSRPKYQLDSPDAVLAVCGSKQMELSLMCLINMVLQRHKKIMDLAQSYVLSDEEFWTMEETLWSIWSAFDKRYRDLVQCWRQQRIDLPVQLQSFAAGIFEDWHFEYYEDGEESESESESEAESIANEGEEEEVENEDNVGEQANDAEEEAAVADEIEPEADAEPDQENHEGDDAGEDGEAAEDGDTHTATDEGSVADGASVPEGSVPEDSDSESDDASVIDDKAPTEDEHADPLEILVYPLPVQPNVLDKHNPITVDEEEEYEDDDVQEGSTKKKKGKKLDRKVAAIEARLQNIEKLLKDSKIEGLERLLQQVLSLSKEAAK